MISPRIFIWFQLFHRTAHDRPDKQQKQLITAGQAAVHQKQQIQVTAVKRIKKRLKLLQEIIIWIYQSWE